MTRTRNGGGFFSRLIMLAILIPLAIITVLFFLSPNSPFSKSNNLPPMVVLSQITREFKVITAQQVATTSIEGETKNILPFSSERYTYQMVMTITAGIDMTKLKDSDIRTEGETVYIRLPQPQILTKEHSGQVIARTQEIFSGLSSDKNLLDKIEQEGENRIITQVLKDGNLMNEARHNAEVQLRNFIFQLGGYKQVKFEYQDEPTPTPLPSSPPR